jgi:hypothetical protein
MATSRPRDLIADLARKYVWWEAIGDQPHAELRILAQVMNLGTFEDIRLLERALGRERLADVMLAAEPGWFSGRSWEFWRGRLSPFARAPIPEEAPRRSVDVAPD